MIWSMSQTLHLMWLSCILIALLSSFNLGHRRANKTKRNKWFFSAASASWGNQITSLFSSFDILETILSNLSSPARSLHTHSPLDGQILLQLAINPRTKHKLQRPWVFLPTWRELWCFHWGGGGWKELVFFNLFCCATTSTTCQSDSSGSAQAQLWHYLQMVNKEKKYIWLASVIHS